MENQENQNGPMEGYRILDLTDERGLLCGSLLGSLGAEVIKIEKPGGDPARNNGPFFRDIADSQKSLSWYAYNVNKKGITLNLESSDGREIFKKLVKSADVVIESFDPGYLASLGLDYSELTKIKPDLIMTSITPFGQTGPHANYKASNLSLWAMGGILFASGSTGRGPVGISHVSHAFLLASTDGAWSTTLALYWKGLTAKGQYLDISIQKSVETTTWLPHFAYRITGRVMDELGDNYAVPIAKVITRWTWGTKDGRQVLFAVSGGGWGGRSMPPLISWMDSEGLADDYLRGINWSTLELSRLSKEELDNLYGYFERFFASKTRDEISIEKEKRHIMIEDVFSPSEAAKHPQLIARQYWQAVEHDDLGISLNYPGSFCRFSENICKVWRRAPLIGENNRDIFCNELGYSVEDTTVLKQNGII